MKDGRWQLLSDDAVAELGDALSDAAIACLQRGGMGWMTDNCGMGINQGIYSAIRHQQFRILWSLPASIIEGLPEPQRTEIQNAIAAVVVQAEVNGILLKTGFLHNAEPAQ